MLLPLLFCLAQPPFPAFQEVAVDPASGNVPGLAVVDINGDAKPDILAAADAEVAWYENPSWERHLITEQISGLNVAVAPLDLNADGVVEIALAADWQPANTAAGGTLFLLKSGADVKQPWLALPLQGSVPTVHRLRWTDFEGDGRPELVVAPLHGVGSTPPLYQEQGVKLYLLRPPAADPFSLPWEEEVIDESLHIVHNVWPLSWDKETKGALLLAASLEGVSAFLKKPEGNWEKRLLAAGNPEPLPNSGAGEIKSRFLGEPMLATVEPWHGTQIVVYTVAPDGSWKRNVVESEFAGAHAIAWADFDGDGQDELLAGHREPAGPAQAVGLYIYDLIYDPAAQTLQQFRHPVDVGGMATEDVVAVDMNGDGRADIVASGRATGNIKLYENLGLPAPEPAPAPETAPAPEAPSEPAPAPEAAPAP